MYRDAEKQFKSAIADQPMIDTYLYLAKVYIRLDQPLAAIDVYKQGLVKFPQEVSLLLGQARVHEVHTHLDLTHTFQVVCRKSSREPLNLSSPCSCSRRCMVCHHHKCGLVLEVICRLRLSDTFTYVMLWTKLLWATSPDELAMLML